MIESFRLITPLAQAFCSTDTPWLLGERELPEDARLPSGGCMAVEVGMKKAARLYLFGQDETGRLKRFFPSTCEQFQATGNPITADAPLRFPPYSDSGIQVLDLDETPGTEWVYAVAISNPDLAVRFERRIQGLQDLCSAGDIFIEAGDAGGQNRVSAWQTYLNFLSEDAGGGLDWRVRRFRHDPAAF